MDLCRHGEERAAGSSARAVCCAAGGAYPPWHRTLCLVLGAHRFGASPPQGGGGRLGKPGDQGVVSQASRVWVRGERVSEGETQSLAGHHRDLGGFRRRARRRGGSIAERSKKIPGVA
jgi:hypothetical protein